MAITRETITYVAHLARLDLRPDELEKFSAQLADILGFIDKLSELNIEGVSPTSHILPISNILRDDLPRESLPVDNALENAPQRKGDSFAVPKIIE